MIVTIGMDNLSYSEAVQLSKSKEIKKSPKANIVIVKEFK